MECNVNQSNAYLSDDVFDARENQLFKWAIKMINGIGVWNIPWKQKSK